MHIVELLVTGAVLGAVFLLIAFLLRQSTRRILFVGLIIASLAYVLFAVQAGEGIIWILTELVGVCIYGFMGWLGLRGSPWWLVAGWALHPFWDIPLHYFGPGKSFAPLAYTITCISFDLLVAAYAGYRIHRGSFNGFRTVR